MVGNVGVIQVSFDCLYSHHAANGFPESGGFEATTKPYFYQRVREQDKALARRVIAGEQFHPAVDLCGFLSHQVLAQRHSITNRTEVSTKHIVFLSGRLPKCLNMKG